MKLQLEISDKEKIVRIEEATNVGELYDFLLAHFPNDTWREFKLEVKTVIQWQNPVIIEKEVYPSVPYNPHPNYPWVQPTWQIISKDDTYKVDYLSGVYCVQIN